MLEPVMRDVKGTFREKLALPGPKRLLALDGGGIRGVISVEILGAIEDMLRNKLDRPKLVLGDYFDYVGGTSTGAIIATCIALGMSVEQIRAFYRDHGQEMFDKVALLERFRHVYSDTRLAGLLKNVIGDRTLGDPALKTLLLLVMRNATTDSPWPLSSNPNAKYNLPRSEDGEKRKIANLELPLWQLVRASAAAPVFFPPEVINIDQHEYVFVDGGVTTYNNPAFLLFLMATAAPYNLCWAACVDKLLLISVGTGSSPEANADLMPTELNAVYNMTKIPAALIYAALNEQDMLCRLFGECRFGAQIDSELGDLRGAAGPTKEKLFAYCRYDPQLSRTGLNALGLKTIEPHVVQQLDAADLTHTNAMRAVGAAYAAYISPEHFEGFL
jgi:patatin-like phospholipase/acyl hydrolase